MKRIVFLIFIIIVLTACGHSQAEEPGALPEGWQIYKSGSISIGIAPEWQEYNPPAGIDDAAAWLSLPGNATLLVAKEMVGVCGLGNGAEAAEIQQCLWDSSEGWSFGEKLTLVNSGEWWDGVNKGDFIEYTETNNNQPRYTVRIIALLPGEKDLIEVFYTKENASTIGDIEREQLRKALATVQLNLGK